MRPAHCEQHVPVKTHFVDTAGEFFGKLRTWMRVSGWCCCPSKFRLRNLRSGVLVSGSPAFGVTIDLRIKRTWPDRTTPDLMTRLAGNAVARTRAFKSSFPLFFVIGFAVAFDMQQMAPSAMSTKIRIVDYNRFAVEVARSISIGINLGKSFSSNSSISVGKQSTRCPDLSAA